MGMGLHRLVQHPAYYRTHVHRILYSHLPWGLLLQLPLMSAPHFARFWGVLLVSRRAHSYAGRVCRPD